MNNFTIEIFNPKTKQFERNDRAVFAPKFANLLDEQLDESLIMIKGDTTAYYKPFTWFKITIINNPECKLSWDKEEEIYNNRETQIDQSYNGQRITQTREINMFVSNDTSIEVPVGSGKYNHEIYLIETTKIMERYISDTLTFTNALGRDYTGNKADAIFTRTDSDGDTFNFPVGEYKSPISNGSEITILSPGTFAEKYFGAIDGDTWYGPFGGVYVYDENNNLRYSQYKDTGGVYEDGGFIQNWKDATLELRGDGDWRIEYTYGENPILSATATIKVVNSMLPLKKWTIKTVIERVFDLIAPLKKFRLDETQAVKYDKIIAPEFAFTRSTLREVLQQIGGFVHAEPRISKVELDQDNEFKFTVKFDDYNNNKISQISAEPYIAATFGTDINQYCTELDSSADNLTNSLNWAQGVIIEPLYGFSKTVRTEKTVTRFAEDNNTVISTQYPIARLLPGAQIKCMYIPGIGNNNDKGWDITPFVFEESDYIALSSYSGEYPLVKSCALYYTIGQKNIKGLFYKVPNAVSSYFSKYAIVNILRNVTGINTLNLEGNNLFDLTFSVTYVPLYSTRIKSTKQLIQEGFKSTLAYNQTANMIESQYFGENLKGVIERLGNVEKTYTYKLAFISQIPSVGTRYDLNYYISNVSWELFPTYIKCTIGLSKNFNRLSQYIGINSNKRMWEVSERQTVIRDSVYNNYIVISENPLSGSYWGKFASDPVHSLLYEGQFNYVGVDHVEINVSDAFGFVINSNNIVLPVITSAFGNSIAFTFSFEDNFSVGQKIVPYTIDGETSYWSSYIPYTDNYGRFFYIHYTFYSTDSEVIDNNNNYYNGTLYAGTFPQGGNGSILGGINALEDYKIYRKDSREIPQITHQISVVTDNEDIIIGSAICSNSPAVNKRPSSWDLYVFTKPIDLFAGNKILFNDGIKIEQKNGSAWLLYNSSILLKQVDKAKIGNNKIVAWALVTEMTEIRIPIDDGYGTPDIQTIYEGGELLLGQNNCDLTLGDKRIYFNYTHKIND